MLRVKILIASSDDKENCKESSVFKNKFVKEVTFIYFYNSISSSSSSWFFFIVFSSTSTSSSESVLLSKVCKLSSGVLFGFINS